MSDDVETIVSFSEDIGEAEAPATLPPGEYNGEIQAAEVKVSQNDTRYAAVTFYISPDNFPADFDANNAPDGIKLIFRRASLEDTVQSRYRLKKFLTAIGAPMASELDLTEWIGLNATLDVKTSTWEGEERNEIERVKAA